MTAQLLYLEGGIPYRWRDCPDLPPHGRSRRVVAVSISRLENNRIRCRNDGPAGLGGASGFWEQVSTPKSPHCHECSESHSDRVAQERF